jgi:hypothetical protein
MINVEEHKIFLDFISCLGPISRKLRQADKAKTTYPLVGLEDYIFDTFHFLVEIEYKIKDMELSIMLMSAFPNYKPWRDKMSRQEYIIYHLEYYNISIVALFDRILHFVNFIYGLGLADRHVTLSIIGANKNVGKELVRNLKKMDKAIQDVRSLQNSIKHKEKLRLKGLYNASLIEVNLRNEELRKTFSKKDQKMLKSDMNHYYQNWIKTEKKLMIKKNEEVGTHVESILDLLFPVYSARKESFNSKNSAL